MPLLHMLTEVDGAQFEEEIDRYLGGVDSVAVTKARQGQGITLVAVRVDDGSVTKHGFGWLGLESGEWRSGLISVDREVPVAADALPPASIEEIVWGPFSAGGRGAIVAYVPISLTRLEVQDSQGRVLDVDSPTRYGEVLLLTPEGAHTLHLMEGQVTVEVVPFQEVP